MKMNDGFLPAHLLNMSGEDRPWLIKVLIALEYDFLKYSPNIHVRGCNLFNMRSWGVQGCNTIHCIGGWVEEYKGSKLTKYTRDSLELLFYPHIPDDPAWETADTIKSARVLRVFLETGVIDWS